MKRPLIRCVLLMAALLAAMPSRAEILEETVKSGGLVRHYSLVVPDTIKGDEPAPLLVVLHGSGGRSAPLAARWQELAMREHVIVVAPESIDPNAGWKLPKDGPDFLFDVVEQIKRSYAVDARRVYLFGHSGGALFALTMGLIESEYFAAVTSSAGTWREDNEFDALKAARRKIPIQLLIGDRDQYFPLSSLRETEAALKKNDFPVETVIFKDHDHNYAQLSTEINQRTWEFLSKQQIEGELRFVRYSIPHVNRP